MPTHPIPIRGDFEIELGSHSNCTIVLPDPEEVSPRHVRLKRCGDRLFVKDLDSSQGTLINDRRIGAGWEEITLYDRLFLGARKVKIDAGLLIGENRIHLTARNLYLTIKNKRFFGKVSYSARPRVLCDHVSLTVEPGAMTAIMGPSGAGKTVLLNLLAGELRPQPQPGRPRGRVLVNHTFDIHDEFPYLKNLIGLVPQDDIVIPELTVHQSLSYTLRLRHPDMDDRTRNTIIQGTCEDLGFKGAELDQFLNTPIGSVEKRGLSGGERKRANIAAELVRRPLLLFLDEPTSGLSSADAESLMKHLSHLCAKEGLTMILTIHQPSRSIWKLFDQIVLLQKGGAPFFRGSTEQALALAGSSRTDDHYDNPADRVVAWAQQGKIDNQPAPENQDVGERRQVDSTLTIQKTPDKRLFWKQVRVLVSRMFVVTLGNRPNLLLQVSQAPLIGLWMIVAFTGYHKDHGDYDHFVRTGLWYTRTLVETGVIDKYRYDEASLWAGSPDGRQYLSSPSSLRRAAVLFLLLAAAVWFGIIGTVREIVGERPLLRRECKQGLNPSAYLISRWTIAIILVGFQTLVLTIMTGFLLPRFPMLALWFLLWWTAVLAAGLGLTISAIVPNTRVALSTVPMLMMPQLVLGGLLRPVSEQMILRVSSVVTVQRWVFEIGLLIDSWSGLKTVVLDFDSETANLTRFLRFREIQLAHPFFSPGELDHDLFSAVLARLVTVSLIFGLLPLLATRWLVSDRPEPGWFR